MWEPMHPRPAVQTAGTQLSSRLSGGFPCRAPAGGRPCCCCTACTPGTTSPGRRAWSLLSWKCWPGVAHKYGIALVLQLADTTLVKLCSTKDADASSELAQMNVHRAPAQFLLARDLALPHFLLHLGCFMGAHAHALDLSSLDDGSAALLKGACRLPKLS